ncbi:MAG: tetratricopeptide repeat protein [Oscillospiraceae bacterium]|nr:tetratricopeptide repeat protein [Oscillospiraceae bacterium]
MAKLIYKTKGNSSPQGKERVFFTCHPEDFDSCFEPICEEIFKTQSCAIWYDEEPDTAWDAEEMEAELGRMQLFVIPITSRFLYQANSAREVLFPFAVAHHIPVLPLMQERGLGSEFNRICGDLQFLDKNAAMSDPTALPYEQKLERFLASVLLGDELAEKVRKAFDAYIFLSYRKKDRKHAQELMRLIHQNDFCRDIAIWYDEFLVPGEDFNHAIRDAMEKSGLFTFVVTPSLLEADNYVMNVEYPAAKETERPMLPVEMVPTDHGELQECYEGLPEMTDGHDAQALSDALMRYVQNLISEENDNDPEHVFFIGLAYLSGIDVEEDRERGVQLITTAANGDIPEAMEKLSQMYKSGEGVERDYEASARWLEKLAEYWEKAFAESGSEEAGENWFSALWNLGDAWYEMRRLEPAARAYQRMSAVSERMLEQFAGTYWKRSLSVSYNQLGNICKAQGSLGEAKAWYEKGLEISEALSRETETAESRRDLSVSYVQLGKICEGEGKLSEAKAWYEKALEIHEALSRETGTVDSRRNLGVSCDQLGNICEAEGSLAEARAWYKKGLEISEALSRETGTVESRRDLCVSYNNLGDICKAEGKPDEARAWCEKALEVSEALSREIGTVEAWNDLAINCYNLGVLDPNKFDISLLRRAREIWQQLSEQCKATSVYRRYLQYADDAINTCNMQTML